MIYLFTWNSSTLVRNSVLKWKELFISKHWDFNLIHIKDISEFDNNFIFEQITSESFLSKKKLVIIDDIPLKTKDKWKDKKDKEEYIMSLLSKIPENNIILFSSISPDKRWKLYKEIKKIWEIKEFNSLWEDDISFKLKQLYWNKIHYDAIKEIIRYKWWHIDKIIPEVDKLLITKDFISKSDIVENIYPELEESIFILIDTILSNNLVDSIKKMDIILDSVNFYAFYNNLLSNLRTTIYISKFKSLGISKNDTIKSLNLWNKWFLYDRNYKVSFSVLSKLYLSLIDLDKKMKTWLMIWTEEKDFQFEMEKVFIENLT